jgi:putative endonuclease
MSDGDERQVVDGGSRKRLGDAGERLAASWLVSRDYREVAHNWRCPYGEIDLIVERGDELIFVEVKTRRGDRLGVPEEAVTPVKSRRLVNAAQMYLIEHGAEQRPCRIDVVAVQLSPTGKLLAVRHYPASVGVSSENVEEQSRHAGLS